MFARSLAPLLAASFLALTPLAAADLWACFGSQRDAAGIGVSVAKFDPAEGKFSASHLAIASRAPSFLVFSPDGKTLYACNATRDWSGEPGGGVSAFSFDATRGELALLNSANTGGIGTCFVGFDRTGHFLLTTAYSGGTIAVFALEADGRIGARTAYVQHEGRGPHPERQKSPHPHSIWADPSNRFVLVPDLGLDRVLIYRFDEKTGALTPHAPAALELPPVTGPRHLAWSADGKRFYLLCELSNRLHVVAWDSAAGTAKIEQSIDTLPVDATGTNTAGEVMLSPDARFVYTTNRGHDSIAVFAIDAANGHVSLVERVSSGGQFPRNLAFAGDGHWLLVTNHNSDQAAVFAVDRTTGKLTRHGDSVAVPYPFGLALRPVEMK